MTLWKIVVRDHNGKVIQVYERYTSQVSTVVVNEMHEIDTYEKNAGNTITISALS